MNKAAFLGKLLKAMAAVAGIYMILPECLSQRVILVNAGSSPLEKLTLSLADSQGREIALWQGSLPAARTIFLGFDAPYAPFTHILVGQRSGAAFRHEFGYFYGQSREMVIVADSSLSNHHWDDELPACIMGRGFDCWIDRILAPFRSHVCRPW